MTLLSIHRKTIAAVAVSTRDVSTTTIAVTLFAGLVLTACARREQTSSTVYTAQLAPLNTSVTGQPAAGEVKFTVTGDQLVITVNASGLPAGIEHWQHVHGFADGRAASCPTMAADVNGDSLVDLIETEPAAGTTMIPLHNDPVGMDIPNGTYPAAAATGTLAYADTLSLAAMQLTFEKAFPGQQLSLDHRVVFLHGVPASTTLPASVASLGPLAAQVTLPIACGALTRSTPSGQ